ncbi:MAG: class I SAM-dependent methyltransferase [Halioglobus sp.]|nr:class I SAM-dependent methyltransferase [Halioglobus sp.]
MSDNDQAPDAGRVGFRDWHQSGWLNDDTGELIEDVRVTSGMQVVDVGCGDGAYISFCSRMGADVTFIDVQEEKVRSVERSLESSAGGRTRGIVSECDPIPLADGHADLVISTEVLEHVPDPERFLREIVRVGNTDATYLITVPDARGEHLIKDVANPVYFQAPNHIHIFTSEDFEKLLQDCGLKVVRHDYYGGFWAFFYLLKWATAEPGEALNSNVQPATQLWTRTWNEVLSHPNGHKIRQALNQAIPKCQVVVARRA